MDDLDNFVEDVNPIKRYGVRVDKNNADPDKRVEYIYDAVGMKPAGYVYSEDRFDYGDWGNMWFVTGNYPVLLNNDGTIYAYPDPDDYTKTITGTSIDYDSMVENNINLMARIPLTYVCMYEDENYEYFIVSDRQYDENYIPLAHMDYNGNTVDEIFIATCLSIYTSEKIASVVDLDTSPKCLIVNDARTAINSIGNGFNMMTWGQRQLINTLLLIMGKSEHSREIYSPGSSEEAGSGRTYNTGRFSNLSKFDYSTYGYITKVFHIENYWGYGCEAIDGLIYYQGKYLCSLTGPYHKTGNNESYISLGNMWGSTINAENIYIKSTTVNKYGRFPIYSGNMGGSPIHYVCGIVTITHSYTSIPLCLRMGYPANKYDTYGSGDGALVYLMNSRCGMNSLDLVINPAISNDNTYTRISYTPQLT